MKACKACQFFEPWDSGEPEYEMGECRLNPPVLAPYDQDSGVAPNWAFPRVLEIEWCGKFEARKQ